MKSIKSQLFILILAAILPALGIIIYSNDESQRHEIDMAKNEAAITLQGLANDHESVVEVTRRVLMTLAKLPAMQNQDAAACNKLFRELLKENKQYATIYAADREGNMFANALPFGKISIKQRQYFQDALQTKGFSAGEYTIGQVSRRAVLPFAYPIMDESGRITGVIAVSLDLDKYGRNFLAMSRLPKGSTLNLLDRNYIRIYRHPDNEKYAGKIDLPEIVKQISARPQEGVFTAVGVDGIKRLFAYKRFYLNDLSSPYLYMRVGIPEEQALALTKKTFLRNIGLLIVSLVAAIIIALLLGHILIVKRLNRLVDASRKLGRGDLSTRTGIDHKGGELNLLAYSFDEMAEMLEAKEKALLESETKFKSFAQQALVGVYLLQDGVFKYVNPKFAQMFGYTVEECLKDMPFEKLVYADDLANVQEQVRRRISGATLFVHYTFRGVKKNGQIFDVEIYGSSSVHQEKIAAAGTLLDITDRKVMEETLRKSEERFKQLAEVFPETIFEADAGGHVTYANQHGLEQFGYTQEDFSNGMNLLNLIAPDDRVAVLTRIKDKLRGIDRGYIDYQALRKDGSTFYAMGYSARMMQNDSPVGVRGFILDITERKQAEERIAHLANHDLLTDLPSLRLAKDRLGVAMSQARRNKTAVAVMFIDLDGFKSINDNLGHDAGDHILKQVAGRLLSCVRESDTVSRIGGDEFLLIATGIHAPENASQIAEKIIHLVSQPIIFNKAQVVTGTSIGIALYPDDSEDMDQLIKLADEAMYRVKKSSKNAFCFINNT